MMFHFYFVGNPEGLIFDVVRRPFSTAIWRRSPATCESIGVEVRNLRAACRLMRGGSSMARATPISGRSKRNSSSLRSTCPACALSSIDPKRSATLPGARDRRPRRHAALRCLAALAGSSICGRAGTLCRHDRRGPSRQHLALSSLRGREPRLGRTDRRRRRRAARVRRRPDATEEAIRADLMAACTTSIRKPSGAHLGRPLPPAAGLRIVQDRVPCVRARE
jgi:hypothetical protein